MMLVLIIGPYTKVSVWEEDNVELISIEMPVVVVHSVYKPPNQKFVLPALGYGNLSYIVIGDFKSHSNTMEKQLNSGKFMQPIFTRIYIYIYI